MVYSFNGLVCCLLQVTFLSLSTEPRGTNHFVSTFIANSYFPAIPILATEFHKSVELINLTITVFMVFQGICMYPDFLNDVPNHTDLPSPSKFYCFGGRCQIT